MLSSNNIKQLKTGKLIINLKRAWEGQTVTDEQLLGVFIQW
jgi:hypothetical protein